MKTIEIKVKNCRNCPFPTVEFGDNRKIHYATCYAPTQIHKEHYNINSYYKNYKRPKWCPLTIEGIKISL